VTHAFEPSIELFVQLVRKFANNSRVHSHCEALLDCNGRGELMFPIASPETRRAAYVRPSMSGGVSVATLDSYAFEACGLIKLDIEGGELLALRGAEKTIKQSRPVIVVEYKLRNAARYGWNPERS